MDFPLCFLLLPLLSASALTPRYLSNQGSDSWNGQSASHTEGTDNGPWASLPYAIQSIREERPSNPGPDDQATLYLLGGTYYLQETLQFTVRDSFLELAAFSEESVSISGGRILDLAWQREDDRVKSTTFTGTCGEVYLDTWRLLPARSPNLYNPWGPNQMVGKGPWHSITGLLEETDSCSRNATGYSQNCPEVDREGFVIDGQLSEDWSYLDQTQVLVYHSWIAEYAKVANVSSAGGRQEVRFEEPLVHAPVGNFIQSGGWRFQVVNNRAVLDQEGEVVCTQEGEQATVAFISPVGLEDATPIIGVLETLIKASKINHVSLKGLQFQHTSSLGKDGYNWGNEAALKFYNSETISIQDCKFNHIGTIGLFLQDCQGVSVQGSIFSDIGYHGIMARSDQSGTPNADILVNNNIFDGCGVTNYWQPGAMWVEGEREITISHNEITNVPYYGVRITGAMEHGADYTGEYIFNVDYNHIYNYGGNILSDFGGVYITSKFNCDGASEDELDKHCYTHARVFNNWLENSEAFANGAGYLYSDVSASGTRFEKNILRGKGEEALYHHCGLDNESVNNVVHRTGSSSFKMVWAGCEKGNPNRHQRYTNHHNIYLFDTLEGGMSMGRRWDRYYDEAPQFHTNLYWSAEQDAEDAAIFPWKKTWAEWKESGNDTDSLWTDPLFRDPGSGDYSLMETSPAWILGIKEIDTSGIGIQEKLRYSIP